MMDGIEFSRQPCARDPNFVVVRIRMPSGNSQELSGDFTGETARYKATKFVFFTVSSILVAFGLQPMAFALLGISEQFLTALLEDCTADIPATEFERLGRH